VIPEYATVVGIDRGQDVETTVAVYIHDRD
jgi:hypothetical protein